MTSYVHVHVQGCTCKRYIHVCSKPQYAIYKCSVLYTVYIIIYLYMYMYVHVYASMCVHVI